jgi:hypothetical protein
MASADQYRRYAAECIRVAQQATDPTDKLVLLQMAETWRRLAERADASNRVAVEPDQSGQET